MEEDLIVTVNPKSQYAVPYYEIPYERFFQFGFSVDCVVFGYHDSILKVLLIRRGAKPFEGSWALPGDLIYPNEDIDIAAKRILKDLTGVSNLYMEQTKVYGNVNRHPAGRVITAGYYALVDIEKHDPHAAAWAEGVYWIDINKVPQHLAFDHNQIFVDALKSLQHNVQHKPVGFELLPEKFTLGELQKLYEALLNETFDKANFRKKILAMNLLTELKEVQKQVKHRPAKLYSFDLNRYKELNSKGFSFEL